MRELLAGKMKNLVSGINTFAYPGYPGSPVDNIRVIGTRENIFQAAQVSMSMYGCVYLAGWTVCKAP